MLRDPTFSAGDGADGVVLQPHPYPRSIEPVGKLVGKNLSDGINTVHTLPLTEQRAEVWHTIQVQRRVSHTQGGPGEGERERERREKRPAGLVRHSSTVTSGRYSFQLDSTWT